MPEKQPTRHAISDIVNVSTSHRYEYGTSTIVLWGTSLIRKKRRVIDTQTWEIHLKPSGSLTPTPLINLADYQCEEVVEERDFNSPHLVIHRETWTKRGDWEYYTEGE